jgi:exosortase A
MRPATTIMVRFESVLRPVNLVFPLILLILFLYQPTVSTLWQLWTNPDNSTYSHGLLLLAVCTVLFCRQWKKEVDSYSLRPDIIGIVLLASTSLVWFLADLVHVQMVEQLTLPSLIVFLLWAVLGYRGARSLAFPVFLLIFAIPIWDSLTVYLQSITAHAVTLMLNLTGFAAVLEGMYILVPAGTFEVALSCSGLTQFIVAIMVAALYSHVHELRWQTDLWLIVVAIAVAILTNILRIYIVVVAGQLTNMQHYFVTKDHWTLGWVLFGIGMFVFLLWANRYVAPGTKMVSKPEQPSLPSLPLNNPGLPSATMALRTAALALGALALGPALAHVYAAQLPISAANLAIPEQIESWRATGAGGDHYRPYFRGADVEYDTLYRGADGANVYLYVGYYARQEQGKEAVYYLNKVYDNKQWRSAGERQVSVDSPRSLRVKETRIQSKNGKTKVVWCWYYVNGSRTSNDYMAKILNVMGTLRRHPGIAVIVIAADANENVENARSLLRRFVADALKEVEREIDATEST